MWRVAETNNKKSSTFRIPLWLKKVREEKEEQELIINNYYYPVYS